MLGNVGPKSKPAAKIQRSDLDFDSVEQLMDGTAKDGKRLRDGIAGVAASLDALKRVGLTGEALVLLVEAKCARAKNGSRLSADTVQLVLEGLFRVGEYVR